MEHLLSTVSPDAILADTPAGEPVRIDFEKLIGEHTLVAAQTGSGKSVLLRRFEELALAVGYPMIVLDSDGDFASLRDAAPNGILVAGGAHGDPGVTIPETIRRLPQIVAGRASVVIDIHDLSDVEQAAIIAQVLTVMMKLPKDLQQPYLIVIDEVQRFASQHGMSRAGNAIIRAAKEGRRLGITLLVATQRVADVSKALTSQARNRLFGHVSDQADRKRLGEEIGFSPSEARVFTGFDKGDFLVRGQAFAVPLDRVRIRKPMTGKLGKDEMIAKLRLPISSIDEVHALFGAPAITPAARASRQDGNASPDRVRPLVTPPMLDLAPAGEEGSMDVALLELLAAFGRGGVEKDSLALLAGETERRTSFQEAISSLLARKLVSVGTGARVRITPQGAASLPPERKSPSIVEVLARLRAGRDVADERVIACLSAAGHAPLAVAEIQMRTRLGPRVLKGALKRLKRDCWLIERRGSFATAPALARLIGR